MMLKTLYLQIIGWMPISKDNLKLGMGKLIHGLISEHSDNQRKRYSRRRARRTLRGYPVYSDVPSFHFYVEGKTFEYRIEVPAQTWIDNHGHGGYLGGEARLFRKLKRR